MNTEEAEKLNLPEIKSYDDLLDPAFKGHIAVSYTHLDVYKRQGRRDADSSGYEASS